MSVHIVIGKSFGDEGKGLAVDYFAALAQKNSKTCLVIRHNGGAQAGHTVDLYYKRFVFHQLSSGSFRFADTFWADTFLPDFYKLPDEINAFEQIHNYKPRIYSSAKCRCVTVDDVLINMAIETARGDKRHGSCGMGINEAAERSEHPEALLSSKTIKSISSEALAKELKRIRREYLPMRLKKLQLSLECMGEYGELLNNDNVLNNAAELMSKAAENIEIAEENFVLDYDEIVFEGAQGLLLDENYLKYAPHLTSSHTGSYNPARFCEVFLPNIKTERIYVTRSYVTRHGAGPLPHEEQFNLLKNNIYDKTNISNEWQGNLRYAAHGAAEEFAAPVLQDIKEFNCETKISLLVTHLNETNYCIYSSNGNIPINVWLRSDEVEAVFDECFISASPYSEEIIKL
jgi:adenylosuccinate synthase